MTITLSNDFHNTSARVRVGADMIITARQLERAERTLCGISDCRCGGIRGGGYGVAWTSDDKWRIVNYAKER